MRIRLTGLKSLLNEETKKKSSFQNKTKINSLRKQISELENQINNLKED